MLYKQMCCFLEVANVLSFTTAAHNLYMSQQAVTKQIAALERELGFKLFNRSTRSVALTPAGRMQMCIRDSCMPCPCLSSAAPACASSCPAS